MKKKASISIFGLGYVGCVSLGCLAQNGHRVIGVDPVKEKIDMINQGKPTIIEKDIDGIIRENWEKGRISATGDHRRAVHESEISIICVGTPSMPEGHPNLDHVFNTARQIGEAMKSKKEFHIVVIRSTVLPGTNMRYGIRIEEASGKKRNDAFAVVSNPEFLREGTSVFDYYNPPMTVLGSDNPYALEALKTVYRPIHAPIKETPIEVAEIIKYVNNSFHALKITFANEIGNICKFLGIDSHAVMRLFCLDTRLNLSSYYLNPGYAYGGSCLSKDLKGLMTIAHDGYIKTPVLDAIEISNENQKQTAYDLIIKTGRKKVGLLGLSFKTGTDDLRYSPVVDLAEKLLGKGFHVLIHDRNVNASKITGTNKAFIDEHIPHLSVLIKNELPEVMAHSDILVIAHKLPEYSDLVRLYPEKIFIDLVRIGSRESHDNYYGICW